MRATWNGWEIEGTPAEIRELIGGIKPKAEKKPAEPRKNIDWDKAAALKEAGWSYKAIAEEIGSNYNTVFGHFNTAKK